MGQKQLTIKDLNKEELLWFVERTPSIKNYLSEEKIAHLIVGRKYKEMKTLENQVQILMTQASKERSRKKRAELVEAAGARSRRMDRLACEMHGLLERFPIEEEK